MATLYVCSIVSLEIITQYKPLSYTVFTIVIGVIIKGLAVLVGLVLLLVCAWRCCGVQLHACGLSWSCLAQLSGNSACLFDGEFRNYYITNLCLTSCMLTNCVYYCH